jgi:hypothetical protein
VLACAAPAQQRFVQSLGRDVAAAVFQARVITLLLSYFDYYDYYDYYDYCYYYHYYDGGCDVAAAFQARSILIHAAASAAAVS